MDGLHATLASLRTETKSEKDHLTVFREFLAQLDELQRQAPAEAAADKIAAAAQAARGGGGRRPSPSRVTGSAMRASRRGARGLFAA